MLVMVTATGRSNQQWRQHEARRRRLTWPVAKISKMGMERPTRKRMVMVTAMRRKTVMVTAMVDTVTDTLLTLL